MGLSLGKQNDDYQNIPKATDRSFSSPLWPTEKEWKEAGVPLDLAGNYCQQKYRLAFGIRSWYNERVLQEASYPTLFIPLTQCDVEALISAYSKNTSEEQNIHLHDLSGRLDTAIKSFSNGAFLKLDSRSPKDVATNFDNDYARQLVKEELEKLSNKDNNNNKDNNENTKKNTRDNNNDPNNQIVFDVFMKACYKSLRVTSGETAVSLLVRSHRIYEDLLSLLPLMKYGLTNALVVREWSEELVDSPQMEFRGFVHKNSFNALAQYDHLSFHEKVAENKHEIERKITEFWKGDIQRALRFHESYVVDFFVSSSGVKIIELNSFEAWTGACLFTWSEHTDILMNGPFEFRIVEKQSLVEEDMLLLLPSDWRKFITECLNEGKK